MKLFCYGTLMSEYHNNIFLLSSKFLGKATTNKNYIMNIYNNIAYVSYYKRLYSITGELYDVDEKTLEIIDKHEGAGIVYTRVRINVTTQSPSGPENHLCFIYLKPETDGMVSETGNYRDDVYPEDFTESYLFVYGTLMKGYGNNHYLEKEKLIGSGKTAQEFSMKITGKLPFVSKNENKTCISGELYLVKPETLFDIDQLEMNGSWYTRSKIEVIVNETTFIAYMYFCDEGEQETPSGSYKSVVDC